MSIFEDLGTGNLEQSQEQSVMPGENPLKCLLAIVNHVGPFLLLQHPTTIVYAVHLVWKVVCFGFFNVDFCFSPAILACLGF